MTDKDKTCSGFGVEPRRGVIGSGGQKNEWFVADATTPKKELRPPLTLRPAEHGGFVVGEIPLFMRDQPPPPLFAGSLEGCLMFMRDRFAPSPRGDVRAGLNALVKGVVRASAFPDEFSVPRRVLLEKLKLLAATPDGLSPLTSLEPAEAKALLDMLNKEIGS